MGNVHLVNFFGSVYCAATGSGNRLGRNEVNIKDNPKSNSNRTVALTLTRNPNCNLILSIHGRKF